MKPRYTNTPYRAWPWRARVVERIYQAFHGGQIRTLVLRVPLRPGEDVMIKHVPKHGKGNNADHV